MLSVSIVAMFGVKVYCTAFCVNLSVAYSSLISKWFNSNHTPTFLYIANKKMEGDKHRLLPKILLYFTLSIFGT